VLTPRPAVLIQPAMLLLRVEGADRGIVVTDSIKLKGLVPKRCY